MTHDVKSNSKTGCLKRETDLIPERKLAMCWRKGWGAGVTATGASQSRTDRSLITRVFGSALDLQ